MSDRPKSRVRPPRRRPGPPAPAGEAPAGPATSPRRAPGSSAADRVVVRRPGDARQSARARRSTSAHRCVGPTPIPSEPDRGHGPGHQIVTRRGEAVARPSSDAGCIARPPSASQCERMSPILEAPARPPAADGQGDRPLRRSRATGERGTASHHRTTSPRVVRTDDGTRDRVTARLAPLGSGERLAGGSATTTALGRRDASRDDTTTTSVRSVPIQAAGVESPSTTRWRRRTPRSGP